jgi:hypothetical protein
VALRFPEASTAIDSLETRIKRHSMFTGSSMEDRGFILGRDYNFFSADTSRPVQRASIMPTGTGDPVSKFEQL